MRSAYDRVVRTLVVAVGIGSLFFTLLGLPGIIEQYRYLDQAYSITVIVFFCGLPMLMALIAFRTPVAVLRVLVIAHATSAIVFLLLWVPAMKVDELPGNDLPWLINMITVAACEVAVMLPFAVTWTYMIGGAVLSGFVRFMALRDPDPSMAIQDGIMIVLISGFMIALLQLTVRAGREQDAVALVAQQSAAANAAAETLERQRTRYHAFTHDDVLATLLAASNNDPATHEVTRRSALRALEKLDQFRDDAPVASSVVIAGLDEHLRGASLAVGFPYESNLSSPLTLPLELPVEACDALTEALTEAMRNSLRHSAWSDGRPVERIATAKRTATGVRIVVRDDGKGFNPRTVGLDRLGVRLSILQRVNSQPGGKATIVSVRGQGTTVTLEWAAVGGAL